MKRRSGSEPPAMESALGGLGPEDRRLWQEISATLRPLKSRRAAPRIAPGPATKPEPPAAAGESAGQGPSPQPPARPMPRPVVPERAARPPRIDDKTARSLRRGRMTIDARIDLHGMTEAEAHGALAHFFATCSARRRLLVLVITGKGERSGGLLRQRVPRWFAEPGFRELVSAWRPAGPAHGGDGALYVRLRNPTRLRNPDRLRGGGA